MVRSSMDPVIIMLCRQGYSRPLGAIGSALHLPFQYVTGNRSQEDNGNNVLGDHISIYRQHYIWLVGLASWIPPTLAVNVAEQGVT